MCSTAAKWRNPASPALLAEKGRYYQMYQLQQVGESLNAPEENYTPAL